MLKPGLLYCIRQAKAWRKLKEIATVFSGKRKIALEKLVNNLNENDNQVLMLVKLKE